MVYLPTEEELKELGFSKKRDTGVYSNKINSNTFVRFDYAIEEENKFYAVEGDGEVLLDFEDKNEVLFYINTLKGLKKSGKNKKK